MFAICFTDQCLARSKQSVSLFPPRKQFDCSITLLHKSDDVKAKCRSLSRKFHGEMTLFASAFANPIKIRARLFLFDKPIKCLAFLFTFFFFTFIFQGHMKVALRYENTWTVTLRQNKRLTYVEGNPKAPFSLASTVIHGRGGHYSNLVACTTCPQ